MFALYGTPPGQHTTVEILVGNIDQVRAEKDYRRRILWTSLTVMPV